MVVRTFFRRRAPGWPDNHHNGSAILAMAQTQPHHITTTGPETITLNNNGLAVTCLFTENGQLRKKIEQWDGKFAVFDYAFDDKGHLLRVVRDGALLEEYTYNQAGQRIEQRRGGREFGDATAGRLFYDAKGRLERAGGVGFGYDGKGSLAECRDGRGITRYTYGDDTMLDEVALPSGETIRYEYDKATPISPARRFTNDRLTTEYVWQDPLTLAVWRDHEHELEYVFTYDASGVPDRVRITPLPPDRADAPVAVETDWLAVMVRERRKDELHALLKRNRGALDLRCGTDQVGTLMLLTDARGKMIKEIRRDSFGMLLRDSFPAFFMPIGFAGGLEDRDTGLVRFGWRDYDPATGRFTALDPARDRRGDGDLYDYCVDDPVGRKDPTGLQSEKAEEEYGWIMRNVFPVFITDNNHPAKKAIVKQLHNQLVPKLIEFGTAFVEADELPVPGVPLAMEKLTPGFKRPLEQFRFEIVA